jgi:hypothetical protein
VSRASTCLSRKATNFPCSLRSLGRTETASVFIAPQNKLSGWQKAGLKEEHFFRNADDPNEVLLLFSVEDVDKAKAFTASDDLRQAMEKAGVSDKPDVYFLEYRPQVDYAKFYSGHMMLSSVFMMMLAR